MKKLGILIYSVFIVQILSSQLPLRPYEQLQLNGPQSIWYETSFEETLINNDCDGYNNLYDWTEIEPVVVGDYIYTILEVRTTKNNTEGAYIEKRNVENGLLEWSILYDSKVLPYQEIPFKMYYGKDESLYVHGFRTKAGDETFWPFLTTPRKNCLLTYRKINPNTGEILELFTPQDDDESAALVSASVERNNLYGSLFFTENQNEFLYWERRLPPTSHPKQIIHFFRVDKFGNQLNEMDSVILGPINVVINLMQLTTDTILFLEADVVSQQLKLYYLNQNFEKLDSVVLENFPAEIQNNKMFANLVGKSKLLIKSLIFNGESFTELTGLYDIKGKLLDYLELENSANTTFTSQILQNSDRIVGMKMSFNFNPVKAKMEIFESNGSNSLNITKSLQPMDSMRMGYLQKIHSVDNNQMLLQFFETGIYKGATYYHYDNNARAHSFMLFNAEDIGLKTVSVEDAQIANKDGVLYPNPTTDQAWLLFERPVTGTILITDHSGRSLQKLTFEIQDEIQISTQTLNSGVYFIQCSLKNGQKYNYKLIKL